MISDVKYISQDISISRLDEIQSPSNMLIIGKRATGKKYLSNKLIRHHLENNLVDEVHIFIENDKNEYVAQTNVFIYSYCDYIKNKDICNEFMGKKDGIRRLLVFDNVYYSAQLANTFNRLFMNSRHDLISTIVSIPYALGFLPQMRANIEYVFMLKEDRWSNQERLYDHYAGVFSSFTAFQEAFNKLTINPYDTMVMCNQASNKICVKWFKA